MGALFLEEILKEELGRLGEAIGSYQREVHRLPRGSVQRKRIRGHIYPYLAVRDGDKVRYRYLGQLPREKLEELGKSIELRRRYQQLLGEARANKERIEKMLHGKRRAV